PRSSAFGLVSSGNASASEDGAEALIVIAQAGGDAARTDAAAQPGPVVLPEAVEADADNVVRLPAGVTIDDLRVDGADLVLVQADGSEITGLNGALKIPTFVIDDVEIPQEALLAALDGNGIDIAAGPDGSMSVQGAGPQS